MNQAANASSVPYKAAFSFRSFSISASQSDSIRFNSSIILFCACELSFRTSSCSVIQSSFARSCFLSALPALRKEKSLSSNIDFSMKVISPPPCPYHESFAGNLSSWMGAEAEKAFSGSCSTCCPSTCTETMRCRVSLYHL